MEACAKPGTGATEDEQNLCQPSHQRSTAIPADHPTTIYVGEKPLVEAVDGFLATAVFGPDRLDYWREALSTDEKPEDVARVQARVSELEREIADAEGRIQHQVVAL